MDGKKEQLTRHVLGEDNCATCKYWQGEWRGNFREGFYYHTYSHGVDSHQFTDGECRRFPPTQQAILKVWKHGDLIKWERLMEKMEKSYDEATSKISEAEEEKRVAEKVAFEHPELWERQMAEAKVAKLEKDIKQLEKRQESSIYANEEKMSIRLKREVPDQSVRVGRWIGTRNDFWCGEYKRDEWKTRQLVEYLCDD